MALNVSQKGLGDELSNEIKSLLAMQLKVSEKMEVSEKVKAKAQSFWSVRVRQIDEVLSDWMSWLRKFFQEIKESWNLLADMENTEIKSFRK